MGRRAQAKDWIHVHFVGNFPAQPGSDGDAGAGGPGHRALGLLFETFPEVLEDWDSRGALRKLIDDHNLPLKSGYCGTNLTDPSKRSESVAKTIRFGNTIKKYGGIFAVIAPNSVKRAAYNYKEYRASIIAGRWSKWRTSSRSRVTAITNWSSKRSPLKAYLTVLNGRFILGHRQVPEVSHG
jgi:hypothetical protein